MGSALQLTVWTGNRDAAMTAFGAAFQEVDRLDALMSVWRPGSDIVHLNDAAGIRAVEVAPDVRDILKTAKEIGDWTNGKFDVTFAALSGLWKFDQDQDNTIPSPDAIRARLSFIDYTQIDVDDSAGTAFLKRAGMRVNLGGIGKGYAVDRAAAILRNAGFTNFMVQFGGDLLVAGRRGDRPWHIGIRDPRGPADRSFAAIELSDATFSTSGDYERAFIAGGRRYHHIIDPDIGEPSRGCRSVTIMTDRATVADALSTGVFVMGPAAGMTLIERLPNVEGVIVTDHNEVLVSSGLKDKLALLAQPTDAP